MLVKWLTDGETGLKVISAVGMGGSGKTTLVASAYNNKTVKRAFDCYAWITVSQKYTVNELLGVMIKEFFGAVKEAIPTNLGTMGYRELVNELMNFLLGRRYVIVLDDVWSTNLWEDIKVSLPDNGLGSQVMLTTRHEDIGTSAFGVKSHLHHVNPLGMDEAMELFCRKAFFGNPDTRCPDELQNLARALVEKSGGLPLAIVALGGAMSSKKLESQWRRVNDDLDFELKNNSALHRMKHILLLSFNALSYQLKCCFLYCCLFPEDHEIKRKRLIRLLMAEGFVENEGRRITPEEVADDYLLELIRRNTLQVVERNLLGRPKRFKMHDLMRELGLSICRAEKFGEMCYGQEMGHQDSSKARRFTIQTNYQHGYEYSINDISRIRSFLAFGKGNISPSIKTLLSSRKLLRVLDLEYVEITKLPDEIADLFNLRYLNLRGTKVTELPKSIGRLHNLQTLDLSFTTIQVLPIGITKLQNLRHLLSYDVPFFNKRINRDFDYHYTPRAPSTICKLKNLQVLDGVQAEIDLMRQIRNMTQLTRLGVTKVRATHEEDLCIAIQSMNLLRTLHLVAIDKEEYLQMDALSSAPPHLQHLILHGRLEKVPLWFQTLHNLTSLCLEWCRLGEDPLPSIQELPHLMVLTLFHAYTGKTLDFCAGFGKLTRLDLVNFAQLEEITIEKGVMPGLKILRLYKCTKLKKLPRGTEFLSHLKQLDLFHVPNELIERIRGDEGVDRPNILHVPQIDHIYRSLSGSFSFESLS